MSPRTRRRARELGIDPETITPAGKDGVVQSDDVERAAQALPGAPLRGVRKAMAKRMGDAHARVVPATVTGQVDVHRWREDTKPMLRLVRAIGNACRVEPRLNTLYDDRHQRLMPQTDVHLGIAMDTPDGLIAEYAPAADVTFSTDASSLSFLDEVDGVHGYTREGRRVAVAGSGPLLVNVACELAAHGIRPLDLELRRSNLEDVFLAITGRED